MFKKFLLFTLLFIPATLMAQGTQTIAYINSAEIITAMPEYTEMQNKLQAEQAAIEKEMQTLQDEYTKKYQAFMDEAEGMVETIRTRRMQELGDLEERAQTFAQQSQQQFVQLQQSLFMPIHEKVQAALKAVGDSNNYAYILDIGAQGGTIVYVNPNTVDATPLVKKQLGIQ